MDISAGENYALPGIKPLASSPKPSHHTGRFIPPKFVYFAKPFSSERFIAVNDENIKWIRNGKEEERHYTEAKKQ